MAYELSNGHVTDDVSYVTPKGAVSQYGRRRSAILATAWLLVHYWFLPRDAL